jgi:hypothetical protein
MSEDTYKALIEAGVTIGTETQAIPYENILPFVQAFNRAQTEEDKDDQLDLLNQYVSQYRKKKKAKGNPGVDNPFSCAAIVGSGR